MSKRSLENPTTTTTTLDAAQKQTTNVRIKLSPQPPKAESFKKPKKPRKSKTHNHEQRAHQPAFMDALNELTIKYNFIVIPESYFDYEDSWFLNQYIKQRFANDKSIAGIIEVPPSNLGNGYKYNTTERMLYVNIRPGAGAKPTPSESLTVPDPNPAPAVGEETKEAREGRLRAVLATILKILEDHGINAFIREPNEERGYKEPAIYMKNATVPVCEHCHYQEKDE